MRNLKDKNALILILSVGILVAIINISLYGFRNTNDGPFWIAVAKYFISGGSYLNQVGFHYLFNPVIPLIAGFLTLFDLSFLQSYAVINITSYLISIYLLYRLSFKLTARTNLSALTAILFAVDYHTQILVFSVMPDSVTWAMMLATLNLTINYWQLYKGPSRKDAVIWGLLSGIATLVKTNLVFFFPLFLIVSFIKSRKQFWFLALVSIFTAGIIPLAYYAFVAVNFSHFPWDALIANSKILPRTAQLYFLHGLAAYLYTLPFIILGMKQKIFKSSTKIVTIMFAATLVPIILWPFVMSRFTFTTFWFFLPLVAAGILFITKNRLVLVFLIMICLYILNTLRIFLTTNNLSHWQFFSHYLTAFANIF